MTNRELARSYLLKSRQRLRVLELLMTQQAYSDVVREAQEIVELALKALLREVGVEPPKWHDVGPLLLEHRQRFSPGTAEQLERLAAASQWLRQERELAFYGDIDFIPTEEYGQEEARRAMEDASWVVQVVVAEVLSRDSGV